MASAPSAVSILMSVVNAVDTTDDSALPSYQTHASSYAVPAVSPVCCAASTGLACPLSATLPDLTAEVPLPFWPRTIFARSGIEWLASWTIQ
jgi:hypothetical protein